MTRKQYRTAMGKTVDMGAIMLQNESIRAVGNMAVNARGDNINSNNDVIDKKATQINRQNKKQTNVSNVPIVRQSAKKQEAEMKIDSSDKFSDMPSEDDIVREQEVVEHTLPQGGLAAAIAKAKTVQQEKIVPPKQTAKSASGVRKL